jgi:hypothetical protein
VAWWRPDRPDRVLRFVLGPFYTFTGLGCNFLFSRGLPIIVHRCGHNEAVSGSFETRHHSKKV